MPAPAEYVAVFLPGHDITLEIRYDNARHRTIFNSLRSGATILAVSNDELTSVQKEYDDFIALCPYNNARIATRLISLDPPRQAAFNKLLDAVARARLVREYVSV